jgi:hypothetical protein
LLVTFTAKDDAGVVIFQVVDEVLGGLVFLFEAIDEKQDARGVAGAEKELDAPRRPEQTWRNGTQACNG